MHNQMFLKIAVIGSLVCWAFFLCNGCASPNVISQDTQLLREQTLPSEAVTVQAAQTTEKEKIPKLSEGRRKKYMKIVLRDVLTENDCKTLIDLNQSLSLIQKYYKERRYERAKELLRIIFDDIVKAKEKANQRIDELLKQNYKLKDFNGLYRVAKQRRYPANCGYHHLRDIENDAKAFQRDVDKVMFKQEAKLHDRERETKMRDHIVKALELLEGKKYYEGRAELKKALELCDDFETGKVIRQRIREVNSAIKQQKKRRTL